MNSANTHRGAQRAVRHTRLALTLICAAALGACSTTRIEKNADLAIASGDKLRGTLAERVQERSAAEVPIYQRVAGLYVSDRVVPKSAAQALPAAFDMPYTYRTNETVQLSGFAADLQRATKIPVRLVGESIGRGLAVDFSGTARQAMESIPARYGVSWEYADGAITFTQSVTRIFSVERSGVDVGGSVGNRRDSWAELETNLRTLLSPSSKLTVSRTNNTITVIGLPGEMADVEKFLAIDAKQAARRIVLRWQLVNYQTRLQGEAGIALNALLSRSGGTASLISGAAASAAAGVLTLARTDPAAASNGSTYALALLNQSGNTTVVREGFAPLKHNDTQEFGNSRTIFYASDSSLVAVPSTGLLNSNNSTAIVTKQSSIDVGLDGKFGIAVFDSEQAELSYDFKVTVLDNLRRQQSSVQFQEYPETSKRFAKGRLRVEHGQTYVISTDSSDNSSFDRRGLLPGQASVLGGNESGTQQNDQWLLLVTPIITNSVF